MSISFLQLKTESKYAVECLDDSKTNSFPALFMTPVLHLHNYDYIFQYVSYSSFAHYNLFFRVIHELTFLFAGSQNYQFFEKRLNILLTSLRN